MLDAQTHWQATSSAPETIGNAPVMSYTVLSDRQLLLKAFNVFDRFKDEEDTPKHAVG